MASPSRKSKLVLEFDIDVALGSRFNFSFGILLVLWFNTHQCMGVKRSLYITICSFVCSHLMLLFGLMTVFSITGPKGGKCSVGTTRKHRVFTKVVQALLRSGAFSIHYPAGTMRDLATLPRLLGRKVESFDSCCSHLTRYYCYVLLSGNHDITDFLIRAS
ncbi:hypothetical protein V8F33_010750 [Rhypophila sp. PSN 637]